MVSIIEHKILSEEHKNTKATLQFEKHRKLGAKQLALVTFKFTIRIGSLMSYINQ